MVDSGQGMDRLSDGSAFVAERGEGRMPSRLPAGRRRYVLQIEGCAGRRVRGGNRTICLRPMVHPKGERLYSPPLNHGDLCGGEGPRYKGFMGLRMTFAGWLVMGAVVVCAQTRPAVQIAKPVSQSRGVQSAKPGTNARLLDENDGLAVLGAALETRHKIGAEFRLLASCACHLRESWILLQV